VTDYEQKTSARSAARLGVKLADWPPFRSILFPPGMDESRRERTDQPACFVDLNLDQAVTAIVARWNEGVLRPLFYSTYRSEDIIRYRQAVFRDLERPEVFSLLPVFCEGMRKTRSDLAYAHKINYKCHREMVLLRAIASYCETIAKLLRGFESLDLRSQGLGSFRQYLAEYSCSDAFATLAAETCNMQSGLSTIRYGMLFRGDKVTVRKYASELDCATTVLERFARFREDEDDVRITPSSASHSSFNHIEAGILDFVGRLFSEQFRSLEEYIRRHADFIDNTLASFDREISFFLAYLAYIEPLKNSGLTFCYPDVSACEGYRCLAGLRPTARYEAARRKDSHCVQRLLPFRRRTNDRSVRAEPGRQNHVRAHVRTSALLSRPRLSRTWTTCARVSSRPAVYAFRA
jgi:DNA mismatch repair protein MutS